MSERKRERERERAREREREGEREREREEKVISIKYVWSCEHAYMCAWGRKDIPSIILGKVVCVCVCMCVRVCVCVCMWYRMCIHADGAATSCGLPIFVGLFCKRALAIHSYTYILYVYTYIWGGNDLWAVYLCRALLQKSPCHSLYTHIYGMCIHTYGAATTCGLSIFVGLFCKKALAPHCKHIHIEPLPLIVNTYHIEPLPCIVYTYM